MKSMEIITEFDAPSLASELLALQLPREPSPPRSGPSYNGHKQQLDSNINWPAQPPGRNSMVGEGLDCFPCYSHGR